MRSFASLYFFMILLIYIMWRNAYQFYFLAVLLIGCSVLVSIVQPYKEKYMARTDALILANAAIQSMTIDKINFDGFYGDPFYQVIFKMFTILPMLWFLGYSTFKIFKTQTKALFNLANENLSCCTTLPSNDIDHERFQEEKNFNNDLPDRMLHPEGYMQLGYDSIS